MQLNRGRNPGMRNTLGQQAHSHGVDSGAAPPQFFLCTPK